MDLQTLYKKPDEQYPPYYTKLLKGYKGPDRPIIDAGIQSLEEEGYNPAGEPIKITLEDLRLIGRKKIGDLPATRQAGIDTITPEKVTKKAKRIPQVPEYYQKLLKGYKGPDRPIIDAGIQSLEEERYDPESDLLKITLEDLRLIGQSRLKTKPPEEEEGRGFITEAGRGLAHGVLGLGETVGTVFQYAGGKIDSKIIENIGKTAHEFWEKRSRTYAPSPDIQGSVIEKPSLLLKPSWWVYNVADMVPALAIALIPAIGAKKYIKVAGKLFTWGPKLVERLAMLGAEVTGGAVGGMLEGANTYQEVLDRGGTAEQAEDAMEMMTLAAGALNAISIGRMVKKGKLINLRRFLKTGATEAITEYLEEPAEIGIKKALLTEEQFSSKDAVEQLKQGVNVIGPAFITGILGGVGTTKVSKEIEQSPGATPADNAHAIKDIGREEPETKEKAFDEETETTMRERAQALIDQIIPEEEMREGPVVEEAIVEEPVVETLPEQEVPEEEFPKGISSEAIIADVEDSLKDVPAPRGIIPTKEIWTKTPTDIADEWDHVQGYIETVKDNINPEIKRLQDAYNTLKSNRDKDSVLRKKELKKSIDDLKGYIAVLDARYENIAIDESLKLREEAEKKARDKGLTDEDDLMDFLDEFQMSLTERPYIETNYNQEVNEIFDDLIEEHLREKAPAPEEKEKTTAKTDIFSEVESRIAVNGKLPEIYTGYSTIKGETEYLPGVTHKQALSDLLASEGFSQDETNRFFSEFGKIEKETTKIIAPKNNLDILAESSTSGKQIFDTLTDKEKKILDEAAQAGLIKKIETKEGTQFQRTGDLRAWLNERETKQKRTAIEAATGVKLRGKKEIKKPTLSYDIKKDMETDNRNRLEGLSYIGKLIKREELPNNWIRLTYENIGEVAKETKSQPSQAVSTLTGKKGKIVITPTTEIPKEEKIIENAFKDKVPAREKGEKPNIVLMGGPSGCGKSTIILNGKRENSVVIDADGIHKDLGGKRGENLHEDASRIAKTILKKATDEGYHIIYDNRLGNYDLSKKMIERVLDGGGDVTMHFVDIDAETSAVRTHFRYVTGERLWKISDEVLLQGYNRALPTFLELYKDYKDNKNVIFNFVNNNRDFEIPSVIIDKNEILDQKKLDEYLKIDYIKTKEGRYERTDKKIIGDLKEAETQINKRVNLYLSHVGDHELTQAETFETGKEISEADLEKRLARFRSGKPPGEPVLPAETPVAPGEPAGAHKEPAPGEEVEPAPGARGKRGGERPLPSGTEGPIERPGRRVRAGRPGGPVGRPRPESGTPGTPPGRPATRDLGQRPERIEDQNHRIEKDAVLIPPGKVSRINANIAAIKLVKKLESENRNPTTEEKKILAKFTGWGALAQDVFKHEHKIDRYEDVEEKPYYVEEKEWRDWLNWRSNLGKKLHPKLGGILTQEEWDAAKTSTLNAFYTSQEIIDHGLWALTKRLGIKEGTIIDPAGGIGHIFGLMPESMEGKVQLVGVELDTISGKIFKKLYPEANIQIAGFEKAKGIPDNSVDLVVSNFPFGDYGIFDKQHPDYSGWSIHNYFFARSLDIVKPGGMVIAITSHYTLDTIKSGKVREYLSQKADLVGAVRLPGTAFEKSAGTSVTTDILVFRKKDSNPFPFAQPFRTITEIPISKNKSVNVNEYFNDHPEMVLGEHSLAGTMQAGREEYALLPFKDKSIADQLDKIVPLFPAAIAGEGSIEQIGIAEEGVEGIKTGSLVESKGKVFVVDENGLLIPPDWADSETKIERAKAYINLREATRRLIDAQRNPLEDEAHIETLRADLNRIYDNFRKKYNALGENVNNFLDDDIEYPVILALENVAEGFKEVTVKGKKQKKAIITYDKSDIFSKRTIFPFEEPTEADSIKDALNISIVYRNTLDTVFVADLAKITPEEAKEQLLDQGLAFENPETGLLETAEEYLSGNVKKKLNTARLQAAENNAFERNVKALEDVQPEDLGIDQIHFRLGSVWIPTDVIESFVDDLLDVNAKINYTDTGETSRWQIRPNYGQNNAKNQTTWGMEGADGIRLIQDSLNLKGTTIFRYEDNPDNPSKPKKARDPEATLAAHQKQKDLQTEFVKWVKAKKEIINRLEPIYNDNCNNSIVKKHNIPDIDYYPNASHEVKLHDGQKRAIARALKESCIFVHATGFGKTYSIITAAMEMRRIGTAKKPMIVVQNSTVPQYARSFKKLYPAARVLIPNNKQRDAKHRQKLLGQITTGDWDAVIIPHSFFDLLANDPEIESRYIREQIAELEARSITAAAEEGKRSPTVKQLAKAKERKQNRLDRLASLKKDVAIWFEQLGIDALIIDESHAYKRGEFYTKMDNVKGIDKGASMRSFRLLMKARSVQEKTGGKNVIFSTATPISNTMTELWSIIRNIRPDLLEEFHINQFDDFASTFGLIRDDIEETATGDFKNIERFATFVNGPELLTMWKNCSDVVLTEDVRLANVPKVKGDKPTEIKLDRTSELTDFIQELKARRKAWDALQGREKMEQRHVPLLIFNQARQAAIDLRLVNSDANDSPGSKTNEVVGKVYDVWKKSQSIKGTQLVFSDLYQSPDGRFNLYKDIRDKLLKKGVPSAEIAIIHNYNTDAKRAELFKKIKNGDIRIVFGSTGKLGIGVSVQQRMVAIHHVDAPLRPMDFEQRNGRLVRQGNMNDEVEIFVYGVKNTLDSVTYQILQYKQKFINQALRGDLTDRTFEDPSNATQLTFEEMMAAFSGNPLVKERYGLENKVRKFEILKTNFFQERTYTRAKARSLEERQIPSQKEKITEDEAYRKEFEEKMPDNKVVNLTLDNVEYERKEIGKKLDEIVDNSKKDIEKRLKTADINEYGHIPDSLKDHFDLIFNNDVNVALTIEPKVVTSRENKKLKVFLEGFLINYRVAIGDKWSWGKSINTGNGIIRSLESFVAEIKRQPDISTAQLKNMEKNLAELNKVMGRKFEQEDELKEAKAQLSEILTQLEASEDIDARIVKEIGTEEKRPVAEGESPWMTGKAPEPQYKIGITPVTGITGLSLKDIQAVFKGQDINKTPEGNFRITTKYGGSVEMRTVDRIDEDTVAFEMGYGRPLKTGEKIAGKYEDRRIELHRDLTDRWTLTHESYHFMEDAGIISKADIGILQNKIRSLVKRGKFTPMDPANVGFAEDRAAWVTEQLKGIYDVKSTTGKIIHKIRTFIDRLLGGFGIRTAKGVVSEIETGRVFEKPVIERGVITAKDQKLYPNIADQPLYSIVTEPTGQEITDDLKKNRTFMNRLFEMGDLARHKVQVEVKNLQTNVQRLAGKPSRKKVYLGIGYQPKLKRSMVSDDLDRSMMLYRDLQINPKKADDFKTWADEKLGDSSTSAKDRIKIKKQLKILDGALNLTDDQKSFVKEMGVLFDDAFDKAKKHKVVQTHIDNYVRRIWKLPEGKEGQYSGTGSGYGFKTFTTAKLQRTLDTVLDGWMQGYELKVEGLTNSYQQYMNDLVSIIANKAFIQRGVETKDINGNSLFTTRPLKGYNPLKASGFSIWRWAGKAEMEAELSNEDALIVDTYGRKFFSTPVERIPGAWAVYKNEEAKRPAQSFESIVEANTFAKEKGYTRVERTIPKDISEIFQKQQLYAPGPLADMINKATATDDLISKIPMAKGLLRMNTSLKSWILLSSFFHHMAGTRSWIFGVHHGWKKANPVQAYKDGLKKIEDLHPLIDLGIKNGLTIGQLQDWSERELMEEKGFTERLVNYLGLESMEKAITYGRFQRQKFTDSLFKKFFAGLKAEAFVIEYTHELQKAQEKYNQGKSDIAPDPDIVAEKVARLINADFGGLHLKRMGRNPTLQKVFRLLLLAPDWTESNFRTVSGMMPGLNDKLGKLIGDIPGPTGQDVLYRKFWGRVTLRIAVITLLSQMLLNGKDETDEFLEEQMLSNRFNKFRWTELDVTKLYNMLGVDTEGQRMTASLGGHFFDPLKLIDPPRLIKGKGSPLTRIIGAVGTGTDWAERPFTGAMELFKTGKTIKKSAYQKKEGAYNRMPAVITNQVINMQPIQVGHLIRYMQGEEDGLTAMMHSAGAAVHKAWKPRLETPIIETKEGKDTAYAMVKNMIDRDMLKMGPPSKYIMINGISNEMSLDQYTTYLNDSSDIARKKIARLIESTTWAHWSDSIKVKKISRIISNARKRVRGKIKRMMLRKKYQTA